MASWMLVHYLSTFTPRVRCIRKLKPTPSSACCSCFLFLGRNTQVWRRRLHHLATPDLQAALEACVTALQVFARCNPRTKNVFIHVPYTPCLYYVDMIDTMEVMWNDPGTQTFRGVSGCSAKLRTYFCCAITYQESYLKQSRRSWRIALGVGAEALCMHAVVHVLNFVTSNQHFYSSDSPSSTGKIPYYRRFPPERYILCGIRLHQQTEATITTREPKSAAETNNNTENIKNVPNQREVREGVVKPRRRQW